MFCYVCGTACAADANYCHFCGTNISHTSDAASSCVGCGQETPVEGNDRCETCIRKKIEEYFHLGYPYFAIVDLLKKDDISLSLRTLKRRLSELGLSRRGQNVDEEATVRLIRREIEGAGRLAGYRSIWHALRIRHGVPVPRNLVARIVKEIDPEGVAFRKSRRLTRRRYMSLGPNFCWHIDGKLMGRGGLRHSLKIS